MEWVERIKKAIDYIEEHLTEKLDAENIAKENYMSAFHFQRVFSIIAGVSIGEYIRNRRLSLAGDELSAGKAKVIDVALKYGYESPDSFAKAFYQFHSITPIHAKRDKNKLKTFSKLSIKTTKGGSVMNYRIEEKPKMTVTGVSVHFDGTPEDRYRLQHDFMVKGETRFVRYALQGMAKECSLEYCVIRNVDDEGYDFTIGTVIPEYFNNHLEKTVGGYAELLNTVEIEKQEYLIARTEKSALSLQEHLELRKRVVTEWLSDLEYELIDAPEITLIYSDNKEKHKNSYVEIWLPVKRTTGDSPQLSLM